MKNIWSFRSLMFSVCSHSRLSIIPHCLMCWLLYNICSAVILWWLSANKNFYACLHLGQHNFWHRSIPRKSSLRLPNTPVQRHICLAFQCLPLFSKCPEYHHSHFPTGSYSQIKVHCLTHCRIILVTNCFYWTENNGFFPPIDLRPVWAILNATFNVFDSSGNKHNVHVRQAISWCSVSWKNHSRIHVKSLFFWLYWNI